MTVSSSFRTASFRKSRSSRTLLHRALLIARTGFRGLGKAWPLPWMLLERSSRPAFNPALTRCVSSPPRPSLLKWQRLGSGSRACRRRLPRHSKRFSRNRKIWVQRIQRTGRLSFRSVSPFDLIEFLGVLNAEPEAPVIRWRFYVPRVVDYEIEIDLSVFEGVAQIMRTMELLAFCIGLILLTRNIIRG